MSVRSDEDKASERTIMKFNNPFEAFSVRDYFSFLLRLTLLIFLIIALIEMFPIVKAIVECIVALLNKMTRSLG